MITHPRRRDRLSLPRRTPPPSPPEHTARAERARIDADEATARAASLDAVAAAWRPALDAADAALSAADRALGPAELRDLRRGLASERSSTVELLEEVARVEGSHATFGELLVSGPNLKGLLGLPSAVTACVFNLDGVLVGSAALHAAAWAETFDELIVARVERTGGRFAPFNPRVDYARHIHGQPRLHGVHAFLASRGISLPAGAPDDRPGAETVYGLANRKREALLRRIDEQGVSACKGSKRYLETARDAGVRGAVVSASANTATILERSGLAPLINVRVDGNTIVAEQLRARPAPDIPLTACRLLDVAPAAAAMFETSAAGVAAARAAGFALVVGVDSAGDEGALADEGADVVVSGLAELYERRLTGRSRAVGATRGSARR
jgi:HAD superfamily hydrolase (TIGR01509 family)